MPSDYGVGQNPFQRKQITDKSNVSAPSPPTLSHHMFSASATIRAVESSPDLKSSMTSSAASIRDSTPTPTPSSRTTKDISLRNRDKLMALATPNHSRSNTVPPHTPEHHGKKDGDTDTDSIISFTPSMTSRHLANWFSGLLGRS
jgi:hypothetical protein